MARNTVDWLDAIEIDSVPCYLVDEISIERRDPNAEPVKTLTPDRRAVGYKQGIPEFEVSINHKIGTPREVDYFELHRIGATFPIFYEERAGQTRLGSRFALRDCRVVEVSHSYNKDGEAMDVVRIIALDHRREPFNS